MEKMPNLDVEIILNKLIIFYGLKRIIQQLIYSFKFFSEPLITLNYDSTASNV